MKCHGVSSPCNAGPPVYPFSAIVGQDELKLALTLAVIDPHIGGVMAFGHRGTGKSTAVRALADLLPLIKKVDQCAYGCDPEKPSEMCGDCLARSNGTSGRRKRPSTAAGTHQTALPWVWGQVPVVDMPLGSTEDRVCGSLDIEAAISRGLKSFETGLLAKANRGFLYIDEVNLLEDHLVDLLLDVAASGRNVVEREGISLSHPARFVLVGSGNPDEGELRPQLLDRFGLHAAVATVTDLEQRVEIVERRERFERDPAEFRSLWHNEQESARKAIVKARRRLTKVILDRKLLLSIAALAADLRIDGHRGEITISRAARALAALEGRTRTRATDVKRVAPMSLRHRLRKDSLGVIDSGAAIEEALGRLLAL